MTFKISNINDVKILMVLFIIIIVLIMFIIMCCYYDIFGRLDKNNFTNFNISTDNIGNNINNLEIINEAKKLARLKLKNMILEKNKLNRENMDYKKDMFDNVSKQLSQQSYINYNIQMDDFNRWLNNEYIDVLDNIREEIKKFNDDRNSNREKITILLSDAYILNYLFKLRKDNAEVFKVYLKYNDPKNNIFYKSYLHP